MAVLVTGALGTLLPKLGNLLKEEYNLQKGVRGEIMFLKAEMESMETALLKLSEAPIDQPQDIQVKLWAKAVRELSYDLEESIDKFIVRIDTHGPEKSHSFRGFIDKALSLLTKGKIRHKIGIDIKEIKSRINEVSERRARYKFGNDVARPTVTSSTDNLRQFVLFETATKLIGIEEKRDDLVKMIMEGDKVSKKQLKMVSVVGFGGLGKTTLANVVYEKLKVEFDCGAYVPVSVNPNMEMIFKRLLHELDKDKYKNINEATLDQVQLITEIREFLRNKRYFIVIDDVWDKAAWKIIAHALIENECGSRVIVTTRIRDVGKEVGAIYELKPLSTIESKKLFYQRICRVEEECPKVSEDILKKCGGVPLAIITIASTLADRNDNAYYWSKVYQSMGSGLENNPGVIEMRRILYVSYYDLVPPLKTCLLYLSLYPEDYQIKKKDLIWKWIGEGFIQQTMGESLYEAGEKYFDELINKSLIQPVSINRDKKAKHCCVHDMVLDLLTSLAREENFLTTLGGSAPQHEKIRRLSLHTSKEEDVRVLSTVSLSHVKSLTVFKKSFYLLPTLSSFPLLRSLDLSDCKQVDNRHTKLICNMFHLRYLWLHGTYVTEIPKEIANLQYLQVLDICDTEIEELPSTFHQLRQLVYLRVNGWIKLPSGFGNLKSLQELQSLTVLSPSVLHKLSRLTELRCLDMKFIGWDESFEEPFCHCLFNLINLQTLKVIGCNIRVDSGYESLSPGLLQLRCIKTEHSSFSSVPRWMSSLSSLSSLVISLRTLGEEGLHVLGSLPCLSYLSMDVKGCSTFRQGWFVLDASCPFRCLTEFHNRGVIEMVFAQGAMQKLQTELLLDTEKTTRYDFGIENLSSLEKLTIGLRCSDGQKNDRSKKLEIAAAEDAFREALHINPNKTTLKFTKW